MPPIRQLPISLVNKIAAGEVIERPASVVKELLENSIDAGASRIELSVQGGAMELVRVSDNGCGIPKDELLLSIAPHATSKLNDTDDLFNIQTLGFRGEALASIAEVSHLTIRSRTPESESAAELIIRGGEVEGPRDSAGPVGTTMEIRHLFFNTPVRRKFLKSNQTEMGHVLEAFTRIALAHPQVHMVLKNNDRTVHDLLASERWAERIDAFFGPEISNSLIRVDSSDQNIRLHGFVVDPSVSRGNNRMQYLFLNGRYIRDRSLQHALSEAYRGLLMVGRFPICFLHLEMPPNLVDVNVHPTKSEVRFLDGGEIYRRLLQTLRSKFLSTDLTAKATGHDSASTTRNPETFDFDVEIRPRPAPSNPWSNSPGLSKLPANGLKDDLLRWGQTQGEVIDLSQESQAAGTRSIAAFRPFPDVSRPIHSFPGSLSKTSSPTQPSSFSTAASNDTKPSLSQPEREFRSDGEHVVSAKHFGFQIHQRYLITEDEDGMVVIDQHALHERILYERIRDRVLSSSMERQRLLIPEPVTLTAAERAAALEAQEVLKQIGIEIEAFGGDTILITAYPAMLANVAPSEMLRNVIEPSLESGKSIEARDLLDDMMHKMSCKAAIKAGDKLSSEEISELLEQRHHYADTHHCPHGRPTALFFSRDQLDRMFKRT